MGSGPTYRRTRQRDAVLSVLDRFRARRVHPTTDEVYVNVRRTLPRISLATVYRNLDVLAAQGIIQKLGMGCSPVRFDGDPSDHVHIRCVRCGRVDDLDGVHVTPSKDDATTFNGYEVIGLRAEFVGVCDTCRMQHAGKSRTHNDAHRPCSSGGCHAADQGNKN
ncbi:transcriptional repressor [Candidatus Fermentibacteria bacterium]|nr:transcriptional repressor [Candidatus Fermentibacteria bacterium]